MELAGSVLRALLIGYLVLLALLFFAQASLIFPGSATRGRPAAAVTAPAGAELLSLRTSGGERIAALFGPALTPKGEPRADWRTRPTLLYFYGNGSCLRYSDWEFDRFRRLGANVLIPEYVGYGMSSGRPGERGCYATADAALEYLRSRGDLDGDRIFAVGTSLGGAVAIDLAARQRLAGLAAFCAFTSMTEMAARQYPYVPVGLLLRHRFETERKIRSVRCPVLLVSAGRDELVPPEMSGRLARAAGGPVTHLPLPEAGHNDFLLLGESEVLGALGRLIER